MLNLDNIYLIAPYYVSGIKNASLSDVEKWLEKNRTISIDCETRARKPYLGYKKAALDPFKSEVVMLQIGNLTHQFIIDLRFYSKESLGAIKKLLETHTKLIVGTNLKFDYKQLKHNLNITIERLYDIMLVERVLDCNKVDNEEGYFSLASMATRYLNVEFKGANELGLFPEYVFSKSVREEFSTKDDSPFTLQQIVYGANDLWMPLLIRNKQKIRLINEGYRGVLSADKIENEFLKCLADAELKGIYLDIDKWMANLERYEALLEKEEEYLKTIQEINWNSSKQVTEYFKSIGIPTKVIDKTKSYGEEKIYKDSVSIVHIKKFEKEWPIIGQYLEFKQLKKLTTSYGEKFLKHVHLETGKVHTDYFQILKTGRISSTNPNLQQIPQEEKRKGYRQCFVPAKGYSYVICDYSQQESRILADVAQEQVMIDFFKNGDGDMHSLTASRMFQVPVSKNQNKELRHIGKVLNFSIAYGASAHKIQDAFQIPLKEAESFIEKFYKAYPALRPYFTKEQEKAKRYGYVLIDDITNRRSWIPFHKEFKLYHNYITLAKLRNTTDSIPKVVWSKYFKYKGEIERDAQNFRIQGIGASMTKLAAINFRKWTLSNSVDATIINFVHDELLIECKSEIVDFVADKLKFYMEQAGKDLLKHKSVDILASPIIAQYWAH